MPESDHALATLKRFYEGETAYLASGRGEFSAVADTLDPECVLYQPASRPYGGEWRGPAGVEAWMKAFGEQWFSLEVRNPEFYPSDAVVVSRSHVYAGARATGRRIDWPLLQFFRFRNVRILELRPFHWDTAAMLPALGRTS